MKKCSRCSLLKDENEFTFQNKKENKRMSACKKCMNVYIKEKRLSNPESQRKLDKLNYIKYRDKKIECAKKYRVMHKDRTRDTNLYSRYRIRQCDYDKLFIEQEGKCAICKKHSSELNRVLCVDHNHKDNKVRGLLCDTCNKFLGFYENYSGLCQIYLEKYK